MQDLPPIPRLTEMINEIIDDPKESRFISYSFKRLPTKKALSKMSLLDNWGQRLITDWIIKDDHKEIIKGVYMTDAEAIAKTPTSTRGNLHYRKTKLCCMSLRNKDNTCQAIVEIKDDMVYLTCAEVTPRKRGKGLMAELYKLITKFSFDFAGADRIIARADIPRKSLYPNNINKDSDWRDEINPKTGNTFLLDAWLKQENSHQIVGYDGEKKYNAFAILAPNIVKECDPLEYLESKGHIFKSI
jgi:RimJ/RimL family protein N-acetyltransferase